ncbi:MAG: alpha-L-fucosidase [Planctomycetes bacterium]|nr:alpha-L-fucosidase [Planctomycetota bacterium]
MRPSHLVAALLLAACSSTGQSPDPAAPPSPQDQRMAWWREARFGMFIHWGLYAIPAGEWQGKKDYGEWIRDSARIPVDVYDQFQPKWQPAQFDADAWAKLAAAAGMKYLVLTSKHHDGFALFDSKATEWDVMNTPHGRDICKELAAACARHGVRFCTYHSIMDWHHPDYLPRRPWEAAQRSAEGADFERFERYLHTQVTEVIQNYRPAVMWFDGEWEHTWSHERGLRLFELCRRLAPDMIVNNRVDVHRGGMAGFNGSDEAVGDFATPEQEIPATGMPGVDWESCMTMNRHWGWNQADTQWKSTKELLRNLVDIASKGGNYLLNVGPRADGTFPPLAVQRLIEIGAWMQRNAASIHGTTASVFEHLPFGRCTVRAGERTSTLYLHVFERPADGVLRLPGLGNALVRAHLLAEPQRELTALPATGAAGLALQMPHGGLDPIDTVVAVEIQGRPIVYRAPVLQAETDEFVHELAVHVQSGSPGLDVRCTTDGSAPTANSAAAGTLRLTRTTTVRAQAFHRGQSVSAIVERTFRAVVPQPAANVPQSAPGLLCQRLAVDWQRVPEDRAAFRDAPAEVAAQPSAAGQGERVALRYRGFLDVPVDDVYRLALTSDDGSVLWLDGSALVDNNGLHGAVTATGTRALAKGLHPLELVWFNQTGGAELRLSWARPGGKLEAVPAAALRH